MKLTITLLLLSLALASACTPISNTEERIKNLENMVSYLEIKQIELEERLDNRDF